MFQNNYGEHDAELVRIARAYASGLVGNYGYTIHDADDILQSLIIAGSMALPTFDQSKAKRSTYLCEIIRCKVIDLAKHACRQRRDKRREACSLDAEWPGDESGETRWADLIEIGNTITEDGCGRNDRSDLHGLRMDLEDALSDLPPHLRELCRLHSEYDSEDARRMAGMAYSTHHRAIKRIREFLERRGFEQRFHKKSGRVQGAASNHPEGTL